MAEPCGRSPRFASALTGLILVVAFASVAQAAEPRWSRVTPPARTFTVELPEGWVIKPSEPDESWVNGNVLSPVTIWPVDLGFGPMYYTGNGILPATFADFVFVNPNEFALSHPTVRFEITFDHH